MTNLTRARQRALARQAQREAEQAKRARRRGRLLGVAGAVFAAGIVLGVGAGVLLRGGSEAPRQVAEAPAQDARSSEGAPASTRDADGRADTERGDGASRRAVDTALARTRALLRDLDADGAAEDGPDGEETETREGGSKAAGRDTPADGTTTAGADSTDPDAADPASVPPWRRFAAATAAVPEGTPRIAVVIDDLGLKRSNAWKTVRLPGPLTLAFLTYAPGLPEITRAARREGHELLVHMPMLPLDAGEDPGPRVLDPRLDHAELMARLEWGLSRFEGFVGINNHMGSAFTSDREGMRAVMAELSRRGLLFLDSLTIGSSLGGDLATQFGVPHATRDVFLDNARDAGAIRDQLKRLEAVARREGRAIAIGHPHDATIRVLAEWLPTLRERGFALVPVSALADTGSRGPDLAELAE